MKPSEMIEELSRMIGSVQFFPADEPSLMNIARESSNFVEDSAKLRWLVDTFVNHVGKWEGIREFRAIYCTRFKPVDGIEEFSRVQGFSPGDIEAEHAEHSSRFKQLEKSREYSEEINKLAQQKRIN